MMLERKLSERRKAPCNLATERMCNGLVSYLKRLALYPHPGDGVSCVWSC